jgi:pimeloyl-ACP methyl ester carboxylesterase
LHNSPLNLNVWQPLFQTMQRINMSNVQTPNLVAYDLRGHGTAWVPVAAEYNDTQIQNHAWTLDQFVDDCRNIYEKVIGSGKIVLCGFGFGGSVAQAYALKYPENIEKLVLLQTTIRPISDIRSEINYMSNWLAQNPKVDYLTSEEDYVNRVMCQWFVLPNVSACNQKAESDNDQTTPQYSLATEMWRKASCSTALQTDKLMLATDFLPQWTKAAKDEVVTFPTHILAATDDPLAPSDMMTETYTTIYNANRSILVVLDIVNGRHGFSLMRPDYIAGILCDACQTLSLTSTYAATPEGY